MQLFNRDGILAIYEQDQKIKKKKISFTTWVMTRIRKPLSVMLIEENTAQEFSWHVNITVRQQELFTALSPFHSPTSSCKSFLHIVVYLIFQHLKISSFTTKLNSFV